MLRDSNLTREVLPYASAHFASRLATGLRVADLQNAEKDSF